MHQSECISGLDYLKLQANDILCSARMEIEKNLPHHGSTNCYEHSVSVALMSLRIAMFLQMEIEVESLIRGALLHDYYLYDWHVPGGHKGLHGFTHAITALENAERDFDLNDIQRDIIAKHMFPMNLLWPKYKETVVVSVADKICAIQELLRFTGFFPVC